MELPITLCWKCTYPWVGLDLVRQIESIHAGASVPVPMTDITNQS